MLLKPSARYIPSFLPILNPKKIVDATKTVVHSSAGGGKQAPKEMVDTSKTILTAAQALIGSSGDPAKVLNHARTIATATSNLFTIAKREAATMLDQAKQQDLLANAQKLAACTSGLARAAKAVQSNAPGANDLLAQAGAELEQATNAVLESAASESIVSNINHLKFFSWQRCHCIRS